jgi:hypothetical protein
MEGAHLDSNGVTHARAILALFGREEMLAVLVEDEHPRYGSLVT